MPLTLLLITSLIALSTVAETAEISCEACLGVAKAIEANAAALESDPLIDNELVGEVRPRRRLMHTRSEPEIFQMLDTVCSQNLESSHSMDQWPPLEARKEASWQQNVAELLAAELCILQAEVKQQPSGQAACNRLLPKHRDELENYIFDNGQKNLAAYICDTLTGSCSPHEFTDFSAEL